MSYTGPGPQLSVLRSSPAPSPNKVRWSSSGYIDFVADCGADPTGVADCGPALAVGMSLMLALAANTLLPETTLTLYLPPGIYQFNNPATVSQTFNFLGKTSSVKICGERDASIIYVNLASASAFLANIANTNALEICDLAFIGSAPVTGLVPGVVDCTVVFQCSPLWRTSVHDISIIGLTCNAGFYVLSDCEFARVVCLASGAFDGAGGIILTTGQFAPGSLDVHIYDCTFVDLGRINGETVPSGTVDGTSWIYVQGPANNVLIENCFLDEHVKSAIVLDGSGAGHEIATARVRGVTVNGSTSPTAPGSILVKNVQDFELDGLETETGPLNPYVVLRSVGAAVVRALTTAVSAAAFVTADAACGSLVIVEPVNWGPQNLVSLAALTTWIQAGVLSDIGVTTGTATAALVMKVASVGGVSGYAPVDIADSPSLAVGVALDAVGAAAPLRVARTEQVTNLLSDGTTTIAIGDPLTTLGAVSAGQVVKAGAGQVTVGFARAPAAIGPAVPVSAFVCVRKS
jgi:hypothetical protein